MKYNNHFYMAYPGNKRREIKDILPYMVLDDIDTIIEPFCGSCAMSFFINEMYPGRFNFILNDISPELKEMYDILTNEEKINKFEEDFKNLANYVFSDDVNDDEQRRRYKSLKTGKNKSLCNWLFLNKNYTMHPGLYPQNKTIIKHLNLRECPIYTFFNSPNVSYSCINAIDVYEMHKTNPKACLLLDPPYLKSCNDFYTQKRDVNIYEYLYINPIEEEQATIYCILEKQWIIILLFPNSVIFDYSKIYEGSKKKTTHLLIGNLSYEETE